MEPRDLLPQLVQRRVLLAADLEGVPCETRRERMIKMLGRVYRQSLVDSSTWTDFVYALQAANSEDNQYEDLVQDLLGSLEDPDIPSRVPCPCDYLPFSEAERRVFNLTRRVAERSLEPGSVLPALVSSGAIPPETCMDLIDLGDRQEQIYCLMNSVENGGSHALEAFVRTLVQSEDRSANGVGFVMQQCLDAQNESPYTPSDWLGMYVFQL